MKAEEDSFMKRTHIAASVLTIILGIVHVICTPFFYRSLSVQSLWFAGAGLALAFLGVANLTLSGGGMLKWLVRVSNLVGFAYVITLAIILNEPQGYLGCVLVFVLLVSEIMRK